MSETTEPAPLDIVDGAFTMRLAALTDDLYIRFNERDGLYIDTDTEGTVAIIPAADVPRFIDALDRLTGGGHRRAVLKEAAREFDCCGTCGGELHECAVPNCGGKVAAAICALAEEE